ncbi:MAG: PIG-L family deacetylase [Hyphomonadaceae bacterium]|jgi:LmbE family N-acetylglucosaminyl deacetylase|nr:PIG-L family deacetylase [Hyphomonadaceae bacterium]
MKALQLAKAGDKLTVLCLGAHSDDIEIGAGGTLIQWIANGLRLDVRWCVLSASEQRENEARASAGDFLRGAAHHQIDVLRFEDGRFPAQVNAIKAWFETLKTSEPDVILTHRHDDAHQDHREVCRHTWNTFRDHMILEYEIPKWDGDLGQPNFYLPMSAQTLRRKIDLLMTHFGTQRSKHWFDEEIFQGLARLRGMESRAPDRYAEGFVARKLIAS